MRELTQKAAAGVAVIASVAGLVGASAPPATADERMVEMNFDATELVDIGRAAAYLDTDMNGFVGTATDIHHLILNADGALDAAPNGGCELGYADTLEGGTGEQVTFFDYTDEQAAKLDAIADYFCISEQQAQRFNIAYLTFFVGTQASEANRRLPHVYSVPEAQLYNGHEDLVEPPEGWSDKFFIDLLTARITMATEHDSGSAACDTATGLYESHATDLAVLQGYATVHHDAVAPGMDDLVLSLFATMLDVADFACAGDDDARLATLGSLSVLTYETLSEQALFQGKFAMTRGLDEHDIRLVADGPTLWDFLYDFALYQSADEGLHRDACPTDGPSKYADAAEVIAEWAVETATYLGENPATPTADADRLADIAASLLKVRDRLVGLDFARCTLGSTDAAAPVAFDLGADLAPLWLSGRRGPGI